jgi:hypothetical protein
MRSGCGGVCVKARGLGGGVTAMAEAGILDWNCAGCVGRTGSKSEVSEPEPESEDSASYSKTSLRLRNRTLF